MFGLAVSAAGLAAPAVRAALPESAPAPAAAAEEPQVGPSSSRLPGLAARPAAPGQFPHTPADQTARRAWLKTALDEVFAAPPFSKAKVGVLVAESDTGKPLYARNEKSAFTAASNVKIYPSTSALAQLGPAYRWKTTVSMTANGRSGSEIAGDLY